MRLLGERGRDVGLHGSYLSHVSADDLAAQRAQIEEASGAKASGTRQHFLRFDVGRTFAAQEAAGFDHDSTLGYNEALGFRAGIAAPFHPWNASARAPHRLLELPLTVMDGTLFPHAGPLGRGGGGEGRRAPRGRRAGTGPRSPALASELRGRVPLPRMVDGLGGGARSSAGAGSVRGPRPGGRRALEVPGGGLIA
jgi:hypothetical protein